MGSSAGLKCDLIKKGHRALAETLSSGDGSALRCSSPPTRAHLYVAQEVLLRANDRAGPAQPDVANDLLCREPAVPHSRQSEAEAVLSRLGGAKAWWWGLMGRMRGHEGTHGSGSTPEHVHLDGLDISRLCTHLYKPFSRACYTSTHVLHPLFARVAHMTYIMHPLFQRVVHMMHVLQPHAADVRRRNSLEVLHHVAADEHPRASQARLAVHLHTAAERRHALRSCQPCRHCLRVRHLCVAAIHCSHGLTVARLDGGKEARQGGLSDAEKERALL